ncbi:MAG: ATP-binding protein [Bacteroidota bacterium]
MRNRRLSLQSRIFLSMLFVVLIASILIISVAVFHYREQAKDYHESRLERKENAVKRDIIYQLENLSFLLESKKPELISQKKINEISKVHKLNIRMYDVNGNILKTSTTETQKESNKNPLNRELVEKLKVQDNHRIVVHKKLNHDEFISSYSYIYNNDEKPIAIVNIPYLEKSNFYQNELNEFLKRISVVFIFVFLLAIVFAYFLSRYITHSIKTVIEKMKQTHLDKRNEKIELKKGSEEIHKLVSAYNSMIDQLEESAVKLAQSEREQAWREMARQVAHEIKNPLTPMRLSVQNFQRRFDPNDKDIKDKVAVFSQTIVQQIDTMTSIASAFSDFAKMPTPKKETLNVVEVVKHAVEIFSEPYITFFTDTVSIVAHLDKTQLVRIITNLVTNANQALSTINNPKIEVRIKDLNEHVEISVADNGRGIDVEVQDKIFEPKFTTKTSGMGLGLPMVKNIIEAYGGSISFISEIDKGSVFTAKLPKE